MVMMCLLKGIRIKERKNNPQRISSNLSIKLMQNCSICHEYILIHVIQSGVLQAIGFHSSQKHVVAEKPRSVTSSSIHPRYRVVVSD